MEAIGVLGEKLVDHLVRRIERLDRLAHLPGEIEVADDVLADIVLGLAEPVVMAAEAGDAVGDRQVLAVLVAHDVGRALVEAVAAALLRK